MNNKAIASLKPGDRLRIKRAAGHEDVVVEELIKVTRSELTNDTAGHLFASIRTTSGKVMVVASDEFSEAEGRDPQVEYIGDESEVAAKATEDNDSESWPDENMEEEEG